MDTERARSIGQRLQLGRMRLNWSQERLAAEIGTTARSISRWERGEVLPQPYYREQLCRIFQVEAIQLFAAGEDEQQNESQDLAVIWNLPYPRNLLFTGREEILENLHRVLCPTMVPGRTLAISGLGGMGKTQTAVEYAYRYRASYRAVLWLRGETSQAFAADCINIAALLNLPQKDEKDQSEIIRAVKGWLVNHACWLLIVDNIQDISLLKDVVPPDHIGHVLVTTPIQSVGKFTQCIDLEEMSQEEGALFLLRRARHIAHDGKLEDATQVEQDLARKITCIMGGLPLALDQAGAYIEEMGCSLAHYLSCFQDRQSSLLRWRGTAGEDHPGSIYSTFLLAFERIEQIDAAAADLLHLCAFLSPDTIPIELFTHRAGDIDLGPNLTPVVADMFLFDLSIAALRKYSLLRRNRQQETLTVHRLVQIILKDMMDDQHQQQWIKRAIQLLNHIFPESTQIENWPLCQKYLPHVMACVPLIEKWNIVSMESSRLLYQAGNYLRVRGELRQAEPLLIQAIDLQKQVLGADHLDVALSLNDLGLLYCDIGQFAQAESLFLQALVLQSHLERKCGRMLQGGEAHGHHRRDRASQQPRRAGVEHHQAERAGPG